MKLNWIAEFKINEVEGFCYFATLIGFVMLVVGLLWDKIAGVQVSHNEGLGLAQILWCASWGMFSVWGMLVATKWGE
ncbi:MAG: hypothetical protein V1709_10785 [Planctomycetota bacterium]